MNDSTQRLSKHRDQFVAYLRRQLVGPEPDDIETLVDPPDRRYLMGTLYPRGASLLEHSQQEGEQGFDETVAGSGEEDNFADDPVAEANAWLPSSLGFSFFTDARSIQVSCEASRYVTSRESGRRTWRRQPRSGAPGPSSREIRPRCAASADMGSFMCDGALSATDTSSHVFWPTLTMRRRARTGTAI